MARAQLIKGLGTNSAFARQVETQVARKTRAQLDRVAAQVVEATNNIVAKEFVNDRSPERRRPGRHLLGSFVCDVEWDGHSFPIRLRLRSLAPGVKVNSLNSGSREHVISAAPGQRLRFPKTPYRAGVPNAYRYQQAHGSGRWTRVEAVNHPGTIDKQFMERGMAYGVRVGYGKVVTVRR